MLLDGSDLLEEFRQFLSFAAKRVIELRLVLLSVLFVGQRFRPQVGHSLVALEVDGAEIAERGG